MSALTTPSQKQQGRSGRSVLNLQNNKSYSFTVSEEKVIIESELFKSMFTYMFVSDKYTK